MLRHMPGYFLLSTGNYLLLANERTSLHKMRCSCVALVTTQAILLGSRIRLHRSD